MKTLKKVTVVYNIVTESPTGDPAALLTEEGAFDDAKLIADNLTSLGLEAKTFLLDEISVKNLSKLDTDLLFNLCDGIGNQPQTEAKVTQIFDHHRLCYTGSNARALFLTTDKKQTKKVFTKNNLSTPWAISLTSVPVRELKNIHYPLILKPIGEDCSLGITFDSVVNSFRELQKEAKKLLIVYKEPVLVEEYIDGRELNVAVFGMGKTARALPVSEITFGIFFQNKPKIVDFSAKWEEDSPNYKDTVGVCPADLPKKLAEEISKLAVKAYTAVGGRDYGRVDLRLDKNNQPYFLEVNLNPDISMEAGFFRAAKVIGLGYNHFVFQIVREACLRYNLSCDRPTPKTKSW